MKKNVPPYYVILWDVNKDNIEFYDIMPYLVSRWKEDKKRRHKIWVDREESKVVDDTKMPETFEEFKQFVLSNSFYQFWARCEYEVIVTGWPVHKNEYKLDAYEQIKQNIDVVATHFMNYIKG